MAWRVGWTPSVIDTPEHPPIIVAELTQAPVRVGGHLLVFIISIIRPSRIEVEREGIIVPFRQHFVFKIRRPPK